MKVFTLILSLLGTPAFAGGFEHTCDQAALALVSQTFGPLGPSAEKVVAANIIDSRIGGPVTETIRIEVRGDVKGSVTMDTMGDDADSCNVRAISLSY